MNHNDLSSKLAQVIEQIPRDVLYDFCCSYAESHEELAMALVNEFWRPEKDDYRSMVQQCLMHPTPSGIRNGDGYDWGAVAADLSRMMALADEKVKEGSLIDAAEKVDGMQGSYFKKPYLEKLVRLLDKSGRRNDAIEVMEAWKDLDDLRMLYIDMLIEWKMYDEALEVMDLSQERGVFLEDYNQKTLDVMHAWPMSAGRFDIGSLDTYYEAVKRFG